MEKEDQKQKPGKFQIPKLFKPPEKGAFLGPDPMHIDELPLKTVPDYMRKRGSIWYWTGAIISIIFVYQVISGLLLLIYYNPADPYASTEAVINTVPFGSLMLTTHLYGAYAMIFVIYIHMFRNYFFGAYKKPRQLQWLSGVGLLATTVGVGYFGYSMVDDVLATDATDVGRGIAGAVPFIGKYLDSIFFGNGTNLSLFQHMLAWHIILVVGIFAIFGLHFWLAEANGMMPRHRDSNYKAPSVDTEKPWYKKWYPYNMAFIIQIALFTFAFIIIIPSILALMGNVPTLFSPFPQVPSSSPLAAFVPPYPPWFLLFVYKAVDFQFFSLAGPLSPLAATFMFAVIPLVYFLMLPFIDTTDDLHPLSKPMITSFGILGIIYLILLSAWGALAPGIAIPTSEVVIVLAIPFVVVVSGIFILSNQYKKGKFNITPKKIFSSFFIFLFVMIFAAYMFGQGFFSSISNPSGMNVFATLVSGGVMMFGAVGTSRSARISEHFDEAPKKISRNQYRMNKDLAMIISALLLVGSIIIAYFTFQVPIVGIVGNAQFGIGMGFLMIIAAIIVRIYRAAFYNE